MWSSSSCYYQLITIIILFTYAGITKREQVKAGLACVGLKINLLRSVEELNRDVYLYIDKPSYELQ